MNSDADFLEEMQSQAQTQLEVQRLRTLYDEAAEQYSKKATRFNSYQIDAATERTAFFEKVAIGAGAAVAAIASFLGAKSGSLHPRWALRTAIITLPIAMVAALLRNYLYPFYLFSARQFEMFKAYREKEKCKANYIFGTAFNLDLDTGKKIDVAEFKKDWTRSDADSADAIEKVEKRMARYLRAWSWTERVCLASLSIAAIWLVLLIWWNF